MGGSWVAAAGGGSGAKSVLSMHRSSSWLPSCTIAPSSLPQTAPMEHGKPSSPTVLFSKCNGTSLTMPKAMDLFSSPLTLSKRKYKSQLSSVVRTCAVTIVPARIPADRAIAK
eukprot:3675404-Amphidinium_carterae.3